MGVVRRGRRQLVADDLLERSEVRRGGPSDMVVLPLEAERGPPRPGHSSAARATAAVGRKDREVVGKREDALAQGRERIAREPTLLVGTEQVDPRDVADEERAAAEQVLRVVRATEASDQPRHRSVRVAGGGDRTLDAQ